MFSGFFRQELEKWTWPRIVRLRCREFNIGRMRKCREMVFRETTIASKSKTPPDFRGRVGSPVDIPRTSRVIEKQWPGIRKLSGRSSVKHSRYTFFFYFKWSSYRYISLVSPCDSQVYRRRGWETGTAISIILPTISIVHGASINPSSKFESGLKFNAPSFDVKGWSSDVIDV